MYFLFLLYSFPIVFFSISTIFPKRFWKNILLGMSFSYFLLSVLGIFLYFSGYWFENGFALIDRFNLIFINVVLILSGIIALYGSYYFEQEIQHHVIGESKAKQYLIFSNLFILAMLGSATFKNIIMIWVALEATTIFTTSLISFYGTKTSWEAAWKYLIICGTGLTIGLFGIFIIIYAGLENVDYNAILVSPSINVGLVEIGFVLATVGIGTKIGLFPLNTWLPDAHGSWPTPISATMSSILLPLAILYLFKIKNIVDILLKSSDFTNFLFIFMGLLTIVAAGLMLIKQKHFKRALAYSSSENMGIIVFALWLWPVGIKLGILHMIGHGFLKAASFMSVGNVLIQLKTWIFENINNLLRRMPRTGILLIISLIFLVWIPLSPLFFTEILIIIQAFKTNIWLALIFIAGLSLVFSSLLINFGNLYLDHPLLKESKVLLITEDIKFKTVHFCIGIAIVLGIVSNGMFFVDRLF